ncbi:MAG: hypothetical protein IKQ35_06190 [Bacilli bacterium]|nr:hypothetical protein [Bacilli bacterium]
MDKYLDIINLEHYEPRYHKRMNIDNRSAIFAPFAALSGYEDSINETARYVESKIILTDEKIEQLNKKINDYKNKIIKITYFIKDKYKDGGIYVSITDKIKKIDLINKEIILFSKETIKIEDILDIDVL